MPAFKFGPKAFLALKFEDFKIFSPTMLENLTLQNQNKSQDETFWLFSLIKVTSYVFISASIRRDGDGRTWKNLPLD